MKCIKERGQQPVKLNTHRVSDEKAKELVEGGGFVYTPKRIWKQFVRDNQ